MSDGQGGRNSWLSQLFSVMMYGAHSGLLFNTYLVIYRCIYIPYGVCHHHHQLSDASAVGQGGGQVGGLSVRRWLEAFFWE